MIPLRPRFGLLWPIGKPTKGDQQEEGGWLGMSGIGLCNLETLKL